MVTRPFLKEDDSSERDEDVDLKLEEDKARRFRILDRRSAFVNIDLPFPRTIGADDVLVGRRGRGRYSFSITSYSVDK